MTDTDCPPEGADPSDGTSSDRGADGGREPAVDAGERESGADPDRRATPRLANAPDDSGEDRSTNDPGVLPEPEPIEPESLRAENAVFVLLGALGTIGLLATAIVPGLL